MRFTTKRGPSGSAARSLVAFLVSTSVLPLGVLLVAPASRAAARDEPNTRSESAVLPDEVLVGKSARHRQIVARRQGNPAAARVLLVIGEMHGDEPKGPAVVESLRQRGFTSVGDFAIWTISTINPDGQARRTRVNARSVDLNRNFPAGWRRLPKDGTYSGPRPASEPETQAVMGFLERLRPDAVISFHQPLNTVLTACDPKARPWVRRIGRLAGLPVSPPRGCAALDRSYPGTLNKWYSAHFPGWFATVELPESAAVSKAKIRRYASAVTEIAKTIEDQP